MNTQHLIINAMIMRERATTSPGHVPHLLQPALLSGLDGGRRHPRMPTHHVHRDTQHHNVDLQCTQ